MTLPLIIFWIVIASFFTLLAAYYARKNERPDALVALYVTLIIFANLSASKIIGFDLGFTTIFAPVAVLIFAVTFLLTDIVNEKFGRGETQKMILIAFVCQAAISLFSVLIAKTTPAPFFGGQSAIEAIFGNVPRIVFASLAAFLISENADAYIFQWFKKITRGKHLWMRNVFSSLPAMFLDSAIFITLAFAGAGLPLWGLIFGQTSVKWLVGVVDMPFMYLAKAVLNKK